MYQLPISVASDFNHCYSTLKIDTETRDTFITKVKFKLEALQDITASLSANKGYTHFKTAFEETAAKVIP